MVINDLKDKKVVIASNTRFSENTEAELNIILIGARVSVYVVRSNITRLSGKISEKNFVEFAKTFLSA